MDGQHRLLEPRPASPAGLMGATVIASGAQRRTALRREPGWPQEHGTGLIQRLVDALVAQAHFWFVRKPQAQVPTDLLRAPPLPEELDQQHAELSVGLHAPGRVTSTTSARPLVRVEGPIDAARGRVAAKLTRNRRRCATQLHGDLPHTPTRTAQIRDLDALVLRQEPGADPAHQQTVQRGHEPDQLTIPIGFDAIGPVGPGGAGHPHLAGCCPDTPPPFTQLHELLTLSRKRTAPRPPLHTTR